MEKPLANAVRVALGLVLAAPLIVMADPLPSTIFPYVVGKAVYTRLLIELAFGLWLGLLLWHPSYRLPRSRLLWILAIYVGVVLVASFTGVSLQRSLWSTYERMQGWVGLLHYAAFAVMLASVFRTFRSWWILLNVNLAVGLVLGLLGVSQVAGLGLLAYLVDAPRISITLGNATYVGAYMLVNALIAAALLAHSLAAPRAQPAGSSRPVERRRRRRNSGRVESQRPSWASGDNLMRAFWVAVIVLDLSMLYQSGTRGAIVGLAAGLATFVVLYVVWGKLRSVRVAAAALAAAGAVLVVAFLLVRNTEAFESVADSSLTLQRLASLGPEDRSVRSRWTSAQLGLQGFADRPVLGWGPENYTVAYDRHLTEQGAVDSSLLTFDQAHNRVIEEMVTTGALGLGAYLAIWIVMAWILVRRIRELEPDAQLLAMLIGSALTGYFVQNLLLFDTPGTVVQLYMLMGIVLYLETTTAEAAFDRATDRRPATDPGRGVLERLGGLEAPVKAGAAVAGGAAMLVLVYFSVIGPLSGSREASAALNENRSGTERLRSLLASVDAAPWLAVYPLRFTLTGLNSKWDELTGQERQATFQVAMGEGEEALESEPREWRLHLALARIYQRASPDDATTMKLAREHTDRASEAAPGRIEVLELRAAQYFHEGDVEAALGIIDGYMERTQEQLDENPRIKRRLVEVRRQIEELGEEDQ